MEYSPAWDISSDFGLVELPKRLEIRIHSLEKSYNFLQGGDNLIIGSARPYGRNFSKSEARQPFALILKHPGGTFGKREPHLFAIARIHIASRGTTKSSRAVVKTALIREVPGNKGARYACSAAGGNFFTDFWPCVPGF